MKGIIIFGTGKIADVIQYYMREESKLPVKAFTADKEYITEKSFNGLPVVPFEDIEKSYPPEQHDMFIATGYQDLNALREEKMKEAEKKGYHLISYIHPQSFIPRDLEHGKNCFIMSNVNIHPRVKLGHNVFIWSGAMIGHHSRIGSHNWFTSAVNVGGNVTIGNNCFFAMNATVGHSISIGDSCFLGANCLVTKNAENGKVFVEESTKAMRLNSKQFLRMSSFSSL